MLAERAVNADDHVVIAVNAVTKHFPGRGGLIRERQLVRAVDGVTLQVHAGKTFGIVGESGCGKSTLAKLMLKLEEPTGGEILFDGVALRSLKKEQTLAYRRAVQAVFQDPFSSLNPRMRVGSILTEPLVVHGIGNPAERLQSVDKILKRVGLPENSKERYAHEFSGGQRQRIAIAKALILNPRLVVLDEPISALDVSIRAQILNLLADLKRELGLSYVFIAHDLYAVAALSDDIGVMYLGEIVETGPAADVSQTPRHPYTQILFAATLSPFDAPPSETVMPQGEPGNPSAPPPGCHFHPRCPYAMPRCKVASPPSYQVGSSKVSCYLYDPLQEPQSVLIEPSSQAGVDPRLLLTAG